MVKRAAMAVIVCAAVMVNATAARAVVVLSGGGLVLAEEGGTFAPGNLAGVSAGAVAFSSSDLGPELGIPFHVKANLNDEIYGNSNSWIGGGANPFPAPFAGIALDGPATIQSFAFGRDNLGAFGDRSLGLYTLQYTTVALVNANTPDADWTTIGTLNYLSAGGVNFSSTTLRHRFNFTSVANVTGVRLLVPATGLGGGTAIDEIELYSTAGVVVPPPPAVVLSPAPGHAIGFDGNDGVHFDPTPPPAGSRVPDNLALASNGGVAISSSDLGPELGIPFHVKGNLNDGFYGNSNSWIGGGANPFPAPFAGVVLPQRSYVTSIAWGRDNGNGAFDDSFAGSDACGGQCDDRWPGVYTIQYTQLEMVDINTAFTGDPATGWANVGTVDFRQSLDLPPGGDFTGYLRHEFTVLADGSPLEATAIRLLVPVTGLGGGTAIDEIEVYGRAIPEPTTLTLLGFAGIAALRRRRSA